MRVFKWKAILIFPLALSVTWTSWAQGGLGEVPVSQSWTGEEIRWVQQVLQGNHEVSQQRIQGQITTVSREAAQKYLKPQWKLDAGISAFPQARKPFSVGTLNYPGQTLLENEETLEVHQVLPTGGDAYALVKNGNTRPQGGAWQDTQTVGVGIKQPLLKGFGSNSNVQYSVSQSKIEESIARADLKARLLDIVAEARKQYWTVALKAYQLQALQADSMYWQQALKTAEVRRRLGDMAEDEFLGFKIDALSSRQSLLEGRRNLKQALADMVLLLNPENKLQPEMAYTFSTQFSDSIANALQLKWALNLDTLPVYSDVSVAELEKNHPSLIRLAHLHERSELALAKSRKDRLPDLGISADWSHPIGGSGSTRLGAYLSWQLPSIEAEKSIRQTLLLMESQKLDSLQSRRELQNSLARLRDQYQTQKEGFLLVREKVALQRTRSIIAQRRYELGDLTFTDLELTARNRLQAEQDVASAYVTLRLLVVEMERWNGVSLVQSGIQLEGETW